MNINQMKSAISKFRAADVSIIKDDALRAKAQKLQAKQKGFTLLELLVVITLLATLATAALVAYEGIGENAQATAAANNIVVAESSIRNFRAVENVYPNQWDNLANLDGTVDGLATDTSAAAAALSGATSLLAEDTVAVFGQWTIDTTNGVQGPVWNAVAVALDSVGINELQTLDSGTTFVNGVVPNLAFNESSPHVTPGDDSADELGWDDTGAASYDNAPATDFSISIMPSDTGDGATAGGCTAGGVNIATSLDATAYLDSTALNLINDSMDDDGCHLVLALGFGKDVPGTTAGSRVAFSQVPTVGSDDINPANNYARLIALYHVGSADEDGASPTDVTVADIFDTPRLVGIVDPEGRNLDQMLAEANATDFEGDND